MAMPAGAGTSVVIRLELDKELGSFGQIATAIGESGGDIVAVDMTRPGKKTTVQDVTVNVADTTQGDLIVTALNKLSGVNVLQVSDQTFLLHLGGKIEVTPKMPIKNRDDLSRVYTPA